LLGEPPAEPPSAAGGAAAARADDQELHALRATNDELRAALASAEAELERLRQELDDLTAP
ncbi:MAG: hypothetical protein ACO1PW_01280, partial [Actinomycetota bacterium]